MVRVAAVVALALLLTACGSGGSEEAVDSPRPAVSPSATDATPTPPDDAGTDGAEESSPAAGTPSPGGGTSRTGTVIITADSQYGPMLFDRTGQAIYLFDKETSSTPRCYGPCAEAWPPVLTDGEPRARRAAKDSLLGTVRRRDGSMQVTYDGQPLYFYAHEGKYQVLCHDISEYGGL